MKIAYIYPNNAADLGKIQDRAIRAATNARKTIQVALIATIHHLQANHDVRVARRIVDGLQDTVRGDAIVAYLAKFGCLSVGNVTIADDDGKEHEVLTFSEVNGNAQEHAESVRALFDEAKTTMWWEFKKAPSAYKGFSLDEALQAVAKKNQAALDKVAAGKVDPKLVDTGVSQKTIDMLLQLCNFDPIEYALAQELKAA